MTVQHLIAPASLPLPASCGISSGASLSVLSYNVLLPNSVDGWWNYKMYSYPLQDPNISSWEYRQKLIREKIQTINADVVCLQEVSPKSFEDDFLFMEELGYYGCEMFKKGRFRPATFWKTEKCSLVGSAVHKDRTLLTVFELKDAQQNAADSENEEKKEMEHPQHWHVLNCHLQAGLQAKRRLRQMEEGIKASCRVVTQYNKSLTNNQNKKKQNNDDVEDDYDNNNDNNY